MDTNDQQDLQEATSAIKVQNVVYLYYVPNKKTLSLGMSWIPEIMSSVNVSPTDSITNRTDSSLVDSSAFSPSEWLRIISQVWLKALLNYWPLAQGYSKVQATLTQILRSLWTSHVWHKNPGPTVVILKYVSFANISLFNLKNIEP